MALRSSVISTEFTASMERLSARLGQRKEDRHANRGECPSNGTAC